MPPFDHLHPAVIHFAIGPLVLAPALLLLALVWRSQRKGLVMAALFLLVAGLAAAILSLRTGEAAEKLARATPALRAALLDHEQAARTTTLVALVTALDVLLAWLLPRFLRRGPVALLETALLVGGLLSSLAAAGWVLRTGHLGGVMVHVLGTHAQAPPAAM